MRLVSQWHLSLMRIFPQKIYIMHITKEIISEIWDMRIKQLGRKKLSTQNFSDLLEIILSPTKTLHPLHHPIEIDLIGTHKNKRGFFFLLRSFRIITRRRIIKLMRVRRRISSQKRTEKVRLCATKVIPNFKLEKSKMLNE